MLAARTMKTVSFDGVPAVGTKRSVTVPSGEDGARAPLLSDAITSPNSPAAPAAHWCTIGRSARHTSSPRPAAHRGPWHCVKRCLLVAKDRQNLIQDCSRAGRGVLASGHQLLRAQTHAANDVVAVGAIVVKDVQPQDVVRSDFSALDLQSEWPSMENRIRAKNGTGPPASVRSRHAVREGVRTPKSAKNRHSGLKLFFLGSQLRAARPRSLVCQAISVELSMRRT